MTDDKIIVVNPGSKTKTILVVVGFLLLLGGIAWGAMFLKQLTDANVQLKNELIEQKKLTQTLIRSSTKWATKGDLDKSLKALLTPKDLDELKKDIKSLGARLTAVGHTVGSLGRKVAKLQASDRQGPASAPVAVCKDDGRPIDVHGYTKRRQTKDLKDANNAPIAQATFDASRASPWSYEVYARKFHLVTAVGKKDSGQMSFHHTLKYEVPGQSPKLFPIELSSSEYLQIPRSKRFWWWNPRLDIHFFAGARVWQFASGPGRPDSIPSVGVDLGFSISSYGETKVDSLWRFFRFGGGYDAERQAARFSFAPATINLGNPIPLLTNLYVGPHAAIDTAGGLSVALGMGFQL